MFNFSISTESAVRNSRRPLAPWGIYDVKFVGCEVREFAGKKDPSLSYKVLDIKFENEDGYFTSTHFFPKDGDNERRTYEGKNGGTVEMPSNFETLMAVVTQTAQVLNPTGYEKMQKASGNFRSFDDVAKALVQITDKVKGTETKLKLVGRNRDGKVVAEIPRIVGINKQGEKFVADNYIGDKLFFTEYEETQRAKYLSATPTKMPADPMAEAPAAVEEDPFDLESLL